jgi:hypothetical protein
MISDGHDKIPDILEHARIAEISEACQDKIKECEREINKLGYWNVALVAYQLKD